MPACGTCEDLFRDEFVARAEEFRGDGGVEAPDDADGVRACMTDVAGGAVALGLDGGGEERGGRFSVGR